MALGMGMGMAMGVGAKGRGEEVAVLLALKLSLEKRMSCLAQRQLLGLQIDLESLHWEEAVNIQQ